MPTVSEQSLSQEQAPVGLSDEEFDRINEEAAETETVEVEQADESAAQAEPVVDEESDTARERGWVPEDRWTGKGKWVDAKTFNRIYETRTVPKKLQSEAVELRARIAAQESELAEFRKRFAEQDETRAQIRLDNLKGERARAYEDQDWKRVTEIDDELFEFRVKAATPKPQPARTPSTQEKDAQVALDAFASANPIFSQDRRLGRALTEHVAMIQAIAKQANETIPPDELLDEAKDRVQRMYPEKFRPVRRAAMAETGGTPGGQQSNGRARTWADLKPETARTLDDFIKNNKGVTREAVLKSCSPDDFRKA